MVRNLVVQPEFIVWLDALPQRSGLRRQCRDDPETFDHRCREPVVDFLADKVAVHTLAADKAETGHAPVHADARHTITDVVAIEAATSRYQDTVSLPHLE